MPDSLLVRIIFQEHFQPSLSNFIFLFRAQDRFRNIRDSFRLGDRYAIILQLAEVLNPLARGLHLEHAKRRRRPLEDRFPRSFFALKADKHVRVKKRSVR